MERDPTAATKKDKWCEEAEEGFILDGRQDVRALKHSKKFAAKGTEAHSSGPSVREKASSVKTFFGSPPVATASAKKVPATPVEKDESGYVSTRVINMLNSLVSEVEPSPLKRRRKRALKSRSPDARLEPWRIVDIPVIEGLVSSLFAYLSLVLE
jgi:hypothetical protein